MNFCDNFIKALFGNARLIKANENDELFEASFTSTSYNPNKFENDQTYLNFLQIRDNFHLSVVFGNDEPITFTSGNSELLSFKNELDKEAIHLDDDEINFTITIKKTVVNNECTIYDFETFIRTIKELTTNQFFSIFSKLLTPSSVINFKVYNPISTFSSSSISFSNLKNTEKIERPIDRTEKIEGFKSLCHFSNTDTVKLLPSDFRFTSIDKSQKELNKLFNHYSIILSVIYLFDISSLRDNYLDFKINGYKAIKGSIDLSTLKTSELEEYYEIFKWVYNGGNLYDKIGLARNIISLHFKDFGELYLQGHPFQSVRSSYKVYERQNIKQYIEIRNKISDQLIDFNNRANKIVETFASGFQKSSLALISFYISAIVIRVLSKGEFVNIFSLDATILSLVFLIGCFIYYLVSRWEIREQRKRFTKSYVNLKQRYTDLLEENDIKRILNNDKEFNEDVEFIDGKRKVYSRMWLSILILLAGSTIFLFVSYNLKQFYNSFIFQLIFGSICS
jgi:hypothetical protein